MIRLWAQANKRLVLAGIVTIILVAVAIEGIEIWRRLLFPDSDDDGLWDGGERAYGTDPHNPDTDGDFISDGLEVNKYNSNPLKLDSDGGGIDDFNEIYTYESDASNPSDDEEIIDGIPNVKTRSWKVEDGEVVTLKSIYESAYPLYYQKWIIISMRDPLVRWYADRTEIRWEADSEGGRIGKIYTDGKPIFDWELTNRLTTVSGGQPSYYFLVLNRTGSCGTSAVVNNVILKLMGYECRIMFGYKPFRSRGGAPQMGVHICSEAYIDGEVYVVDYNDAFPKDNFYETNGWDVREYYPEWYEDVAGDR